MTPSTFSATLEESLRLIDDAVSRIENGEGGRPELDSLRGLLIDILDVIEQNPGIEAAADDLYEVAAKAITAAEGAASHRSTALKDDVAARQFGRIFKLSAASGGRSPARGLQDAVGALTAFVSKLGFADAGTRVKPRVVLQVVSHPGGNCPKFAPNAA